MAPNSRPPLTSRIRASFEGKRKAEVTSPINTDFVTQDPIAFRSAIDAAINSEEFQNAIAANLARIINPSIKDALDTLQPLVESVYSHEVLLRKTNRSVENILHRIDTQASRNGEITPKPPGSPSTPTTPRRQGSGDSSNPQDIENFRQSLEKNNKRTVATLAELSNAVDTNNKKIEEVVLGIEDLHATLGPTKDNLETIKSSSEQSNTTTAVVQAQLDQLQADIGVVLEVIGTDLGKKINSIHEQVADHPTQSADHATKLDAISTDLVALKGQADKSERVQAIAADLKDNFAALGSQVGSVLTAVEAHGGDLREIKNASANPELLNAVQQYNDSHASHAILLGEIKERTSQLSSKSLTAPVSGDNTESIAALETLKADLAALRENLEAGLASHDDNLTGLGSKVDNVISTVEGHKAADQSGEILAAIRMSHELHASHAEALEGVKSVSNEAPAAALLNDTNFAALEAQIATLQTILATHTAGLDQIKAASTPASRDSLPVEDSGSNVEELQSKITTVITKLDKHTDLLNELKDDVGAEILTALHDVGTTQASHSTLLAEVREADVSDEILTALHASNDAHSGHNTALEKLEAGVQASNDSHATHKASFEDIKSRSVEPSHPAEPGDLSALEAQVTALTAMLEEHKITLAEIKDATSASNESHAAQVASLDELKLRSVEAQPVSSANPEVLEAQISAITASLEEHKATLAEIKTATDFSNEFHTAHNTSLEEIKLKSVEAGPAGSGNTEALEAQINTISASLEEHKATLAEIKDATASSNAHYATHASTLDEIKAAAFASNESHAAHTATLAELKTVQPRESPGVDNPPEDLSAFEAHFTSIISTLEGQNVTLAEIKESNTTGDLLTSFDRNHELNAINHDLITSHTTLLNSIKAESSRADILSSISELKTSIEESRSGVDAHGALVKDLHEETKSSYSALTTSIGALTLGGAARASAAALESSDDDKSSQILEEVKAVRSLIETSSASVDTTKESITSIASQIEINHTTVTTSITTLSDELKAEIDATGTQLNESITSLTSSVEAIDISNLNSTIDGCKVEVKTLTTSIETLGEDIHLDGVHLNDKGVGQLKEHASSGERGVPMSENTWFKRGVDAREADGSEEEDGENEYHHLSPVTEEHTPTHQDAPMEEPERKLESKIPAFEELVADGSNFETPVDPTPALEPTSEEPTPGGNSPEDKSFIEEETEPEALPAKVEELKAVSEPVKPISQAIPLAEEEPALFEQEETKTPDAVKEPENGKEAASSPGSNPDVNGEPVLVAEKEPSPELEETKETTQSPAPIPEVEGESYVVAKESSPEHVLELDPEVAEEPTLEGEENRESTLAEDEPKSPSSVIFNPETTDTPAPDSEESPLPPPKGKSRASSPPPITPITHDVNAFDEASPSSPLSPVDDTEAESASTSAFASPSGPLSPNAPFSPGSGGDGKKGKKGKKEKKEKVPKKKKEKVPFIFDGEDPEE